MSAIKTRAINCHAKDHKYSIGSIIPREPKALWADLLNDLHVLEA
jgi:hypothetical protein